MGITKMIRRFEKASIRAFGLSYANLKLCELGDQSMIEVDASGRTQTVSAKLIYTARGVQHTSIDLNGNEGALVINLDKPVPDYLLNKFDLVTNYGTVEHVNNQFQVLKNIHDMTRQNGIMIHSFPPVGQWPEHCRYYYTIEFVKQLAKLCNYEIINLKVLKTFVEKEYRKDDNYDFIMVTFQKTSDKFATKDQFKQNTLFDTGDLTNTSGNRERPHKLGSIVTIAIVNLIKHRTISVWALFFISSPWFRAFFHKSLRIALSIKKFIT
jgi:hypothetical protein